MEEEEQLFKIDIDCDDNDTDDKKVEYDVDQLLMKDGICDEEAPSKGSTENSVSGEKCWNCDKPGHSLRDCPVPRQRDKINRAKKTFLISQSASKRYHDNKFTKFRPGYYSSALREALGLKDNEVPQHIYKMRILGYPPGWLAESKITNSGIKMYNSHGKRVPEIGEEEGEIINKIMKYDVEKLVEFPGFNVPLKKGVKDHCRSYGYPDIKRQDNIQAFIKHLEFLSNKSGDMSDSTDDESVDMDVCEIQHSDIIEEGEIVSSPSRSNDTKSSGTPEEGEIENSTDSKIESNSSSMNKQDKSSKINPNQTEGSLGIEEKSKSDKIEESKTNLDQLNDNKQTSDSAEGVTSQTKSNESTQIADNSVANKVLVEGETSLTIVNESTQIAVKSDNSVSAEDEKTLIISNESTQTADKSETNSVSAEGETSLLISNESTPIADKSDTNSVSAQGEKTLINSNESIQTVDKSETNSFSAKGETSLLISNESTKIAGKSVINKMESIGDSKIVSSSETNTEISEPTNLNEKSTIESISTVKETEIEEMEMREISPSNMNKKRHLTEDCAKECDSDLDIKRRKSNDPIVENMVSRNETIPERMEDEVKTEHDNIQNELKENEISKSDIKESSKSTSDASKAEEETLTNKLATNEQSINELTSENSFNDSVTLAEINGTISPSTNSFIKRSLPIDIQQNSGNSSPRGSVTSSSHGTPNLKSHSPYSKLPSFENFNKDISDVIDFENLPDSVGKYKTMCSTISKIRDFMSSKISKMKRK